MRRAAVRAWISLVVRTAMVAGCLVMPASLRAASTLDRSGRFAIQWWTIDDGLPEVPINGVAFAPDGSLFCTSPTRLCRFDGVAEQVTGGLPGRTAAVRRSLPLTEPREPVVVTARAR